MTTILTALSKQLKIEVRRYVANQYSFSYCMYHDIMCKMKIRLTLNLEMTSFIYSNFFGVILPELSGFFLSFLFCVFYAE